jgi:transcriptional regulator with XRE-family HTH domain
MSDDTEIATDDSIRDSISSAITEVESTEEVTEKPARTRDARGKFAKAEGVTPDGLIADARPAEPIESDELEIEQIKAPQSWTKEAKEQFASFDPLVQKELIKRETDYSKGIQRHAEGAKWAEETRPIFEQWQPYLNQLGTTPHQAFKALIQAEYTLRHGSPQHKQQALAKMAQDYGIPLAQPSETQQADTSSQPIYDELNNLRHQILQQQQYQQQQQQRIAQDQEAQMQEMIIEFSQNDAYPHFEEVRESMAQLLQGGVAESLEEAYNKAAWSNPEIRSSLIQSEEAKRIKNQAGIARSAKSKASSIHGSPSGAETPATALSIRDQLQQAMTGDSRRV